MNFMNFTKAFKTKNFLFASLIQCWNNVYYSRIILVPMKCKPRRTKNMDFVCLFIYTNLWVWHGSKLSLISFLEVFTGSCAFHLAEILNVMILCLERIISLVNWVSLFSGVERLYTTLKVKFYWRCRMSILQAILFCQTLESVCMWLF